MVLNTNKSVIWGPGNSTEYRASFPQNDCWLQIAAKEWQPEDGVNVLGVPITFENHPTHLQNTFNKHLQSLQAVLDAIARIPDHQLSHHLLRSCADACKLVYLLKNTPITTTEKLACEADRRIYAALEAVVGAGLPSTTRAQCTLPFRLGGCALKSCEVVRAPLRLATILHFLQQRHIIQSQHAHCPADRDTVLLVLQQQLPANLEPLCSWITNPAQMEGADATYVKSHWWTDNIYKHIQSILANAALGRDIPRLESQKTGQGTGWMAARPSTANRTSITPHLYRLGLKWWLGLPIIPPNTTCHACNYPLTQLVTIYSVAHTTITRSGIMKSKTR